MRKLAPAFILTSIVALSSGSALALGDMNKKKTTPSVETPASQTTAIPGDKAYGASTKGSIGNAAPDTGIGGATAVPSASPSMSTTDSSTMGSGTTTTTTDSSVAATTAPSNGDTAMKKDKKMKKEKAAGSSGSGA